ncbi:MAG: deoxyribodipyrimidine photo-lyase [Hyphomicrobiales bacterium]|nr:deoxyribodipyrimidine photo-lyase [Hyphomicrobiales bacterium]
MRSRGRGHSGSAPAIVWFRDDLRLADNPALAAGVASGRPLICLYIHDEESEGVRPLGGASKWWLHGALDELGRSLHRLGGELVIMRGKSARILERVATECHAGSMFWNRRYDGAGRAIDERIKAALTARGMAVKSFGALLLHEPWTLKNASGEPFRVFTPFWRAALSAPDPLSPLPLPKRLSRHALTGSLQGLACSLASLELEPRAPDWAAGLRTTWKRGENAGQARLAAFLEEGLRGYANDRDRPDKASTSRLSPYLRFGNLSPRQIRQGAMTAVASGAARASPRDLDTFLAELGWREFSYHLLFHNPEVAAENLNRRFDRMPWRHDRRALRAWQRGETGYALVDAGMRQLWSTGWMHNRVRMVTASFLIKHLLIDWREGERWFWDTLVDADPANNAASWQWVAGSGADAAPFFRIFNPILQGQKFDPHACYAKRWIPELAAFPADLIYRPGADSPDHLPFGTPSKAYAQPIVEHGSARRRALEAFQGLGE